MTDLREAEAEAREAGELVREVWMQWAREQLDVAEHPSWLVPWADLSERDREVDKRIEAAVTAAVAARYRGLVVALKRYPFPDAGAGSTSEVAAAADVLAALAENAAPLCICGHDETTHIHDDDGHDWCGFAGHPGCYIDDGKESDYDGAEHAFTPLGRHNFEAARYRGADTLVREFHEAFAGAFGGHISDTPTLALATQRLRVALIREELGEYEEALAAGDIVGVADALADLAYVVYGAALTHGLPLDALIAEVHRSNMTKLGSDGRPIYREDGKVLKGPNYSPPDIASVLAENPAPAASALLQGGGHLEERYPSVPGPAIDDDDFDRAIAALDGAVPVARITDEAMVERVAEVIWAALWPNSMTLAHARTTMLYTDRVTLVDGAARAALAVIAEEEGADA